MEYQKVSSPTLSKKLTNGYSFGGKSIYDGVFSCPGKVGSLVEEDYGAIFGGSSSCSIPILDVPELNERKVSVDVNSSILDYSKIFGGYGEFDFAVPHEELSAKPKEKDSVIKEARTPAETESHTSNSSVENQLLSHEASYQSLDGVKQSKMFYHKTNQGGKNETKGTTHIAQFHAVPGYTCLIDEAAPSQTTEGGKPLSSVSNNTYHNRNFSGEVMEGKLSGKAMSTHPLGTARKHAFRDGVKSKTKSNRSRSNSNDILFDAYEIDFGPHPSNVPPPSTRLHNTGNNKGDSKISMTSKFGVSKSHSSEDAADICSPPYFEEEIDANSVAAASAAAVKKAIEEAQAKIRIAKEIMERKKEGLQNHVKVRFNNSLKSEERREGKIADKVNKFREEASEKYGKVNIPMPVAGLGTQNAMKAGQVAPDLRERDNLLFAKGASGEMLGNKNKITPVDHRQEEMNDRMQSVNECELKEESFTMQSFERPEENGEKLEVAEEANKQVETERKLNIAEAAFEVKECADEPKSGQEGHDQEEYGKKLRVSGQLEEIEVMSKASLEVEASEKKLRMFQEPTENEKKQEMQESKDNQQEWLENEQKQKEVFKQENNDTRSEYVPEREENEAGPHELFDQKENGKGDKAACERVEFEKQQKEPCPTGENEIGPKDVHRREQSEKMSDKAEEQEKVQVRMYDLHDGKKSVKKLDEDGELRVKEKLIEAEENVKILNKAYEMIETESSQKESCEWTESEQMQAGIDQRLEDEELEVNREALEHCKNDLEADNNVCKQDRIEILNENLEASGHEENKVCMEIPEHEENGEVMEVTHPSSESKEMETESNAVEVANELEKKELSEVEIGGSAQVVLEFNEIKTQVKDTTEPFDFEYNRVNLGTTDIDVPEKQNDLHGKESRTVCNAGNHIKELTCESEEIFEDAEEVDVAMEQEEDESNFEFWDEERWVDNGKNVEATTLPSIFEGEGETTETSDAIKTSQNTERNEDIYSKTLEAEETKAQASMQKEGELEKGNVRNIDEIKEKEREREKERMAVERAIREARERAFTEARERAERAAAEKANMEARRRAMAEARERLEKASAETNDRSSADKTFMEARLKAERAAVERATAEARERALEKAMSEKAALAAARNQAVKSSGASRDNGMRQSSASNDSQYRGSGPTRSSGHPNSSNINVPCSNDKFVGVNGESILRDKASLERHKRTAERAAKALAEKNMRDLLAQKEQAERNRLAVALDADVKRWSSGKSRNLRALLSSLQYILGPDSGWQPIPLTELVATTAVKKAYRKATLFVHPDKLQQRGASIQQKYTCEKVFDLLKDAWNKFSAEER